MARIVTLWLTFGSAAFLFAVGFVNSLPTDGEGLTRGGTVSALLTFSKFLGITAAGFFGLYGLLHDYKDKKGHVTRQGKIAQFGILGSAFLSALSLVLGEIKAADASAARQLQILKENARSQALLTELADLSNKIVIEEASITMEITAPLDNDVMEHFEGNYFPLLTRAQLRECLEGIQLVEFFYEQADSSLTEDDVEHFQSLFGHCLTVSPVPGHVIDLRSTRIAFRRGRLDKDEIGFFRIDPLQYRESALKPIGHIVGLSEPDTWEYELDDVPVRYRSNALFSASDFAGIWLTVELFPFSYVVTDGTSPVTALLTRLDFDTEDGRSVTLYESDFQVIEQNDASVVYGYKFPTDPEAVQRLFASD